LKLFGILTYRSNYFVSKSN